MTITVLSESVLFAIPMARERRPLQSVRSARLCGDLSVAQVAQLEWVELKETEGELTGVPRCA